MTDEIEAQEETPEEPQDQPEADAPEAEAATEEAPEETPAEPAEAEEAEAEEPEAEEAAEQAEEAEPEVPVAVLARDGNSDFQIVVVGDASQTELFAAEELAKYVEAMSGVKLPVVEGGGEVGKPILIGRAADENPADAGIKHDGFVVDIEPDRIKLFGGRDRGTLYAVYDLLQRLGCSWPLPGEDYEFVPESPELTLEPGRRVSNPRFPMRSFCEDASYVDHSDEAAKEARMMDDVEFIDWLPKNKLSHFMVRGPDDVMEVLLAEMATRDLSWEAGGHIIPLLLPRELFEQKPELFRMTTKGERHPSGNLCVSNDEAIATVVENAVKYAEARPQAEVIHLWGEDLVDGGWCCCERCRDLLPQDQYLKVCNAVARALADREVRIDFIAYHDTLEPEFSDGRPAENLLLLFAPRERSYGSAIGDPTCRENQPYAMALRKWAELFPGRVLIFEYYDDAILYGSLGIPIHDTIAADLGFYEALGVHGMQSLMFGRYSWWAYPLNMYMFARLAWDASVDVHDLTTEFCKTLYGPAGAPLAEFFDRFEEGIRGIVSYGDIKHPERAHGPVRQVASRVSECMASFNEARAFLEQGASRVAEDSREGQEIFKQRRLWIYTVGELEGVSLTAEGYSEAASAAKADPELRAQYLRAAHAKLMDAIGVFRGGLDLMGGDLEVEIKGQWGATGLVDYHENLIRRLEAKAEECLKAIPPPPEPEPAPEPEAKAEAEPAAAEGEAAPAEAQAPVEGSPVAQPDAGEASQEPASE